MRVALLLVIALVTVALVPCALWLPPRVIVGRDLLCDEWDGGQICSTDATFWQTLERPSAFVADAGIITAFWGGLTCEAGDLLVAVTPRGLSIAGCNAPSGSGLLRTRFFIPRPLLVACLIVPAALVAGAMAIAARRRSWRAARLRAAGRCVGCGYDLTGNTSGACPECGLAISREGRTRRHHSAGA